MLSIKLTISRLGQSRRIIIILLSQRFDFVYMVNSTLQADHTDETALEGLEAAALVMALVVLEEVGGVEALELEEALQLLDCVELAKHSFNPKCYRYDEQSKDLPSSHHEQDLNSKDLLLPQQ